MKGFLLLFGAWIVLTVAGAFIAYFFETWRLEINDQAAKNTLFVEEDEGLVQLLAEGLPKPEPDPKQLDEKEFEEYLRTSGLLGDKF